MVVSVKAVRQRSGQLHHPRRVIEDELDGFTQFFTMVFGHLEAPERMGVGVTRTAGDQRCDSTGVIGLNAVLGKAGEIGGELHRHVGAECRVVAGIPEHNSQRFATRALDM